MTAIGRIEPNVDVDLYLEFLEKSHKQQKVLIEMLKVQLQEQHKLREADEEEIRQLRRTLQKRSKK